MNRVDPSSHGVYMQCSCCYISLSRWAGWLSLAGALSFFCPWHALALSIDSFLLYEEVSLGIINQARKAQNMKEEEGRKKKKKEALGGARPPLPFES